MHKIVIEGRVPPAPGRRSVELFADNRFKPRVIRSKRMYSRKQKIRSQPE
jgi:hypothetical protein